MKTKKIKTPKPLRAYAIVDRYKPKFNALNVFKDKEEIEVWSTERMCEVEIVFKRFV